MKKWQNGFFFLDYIITPPKEPVAGQHQVPPY